ncbi:MAG: hypothetical protein K8U03_00705 [Planctomycetia bacterium]|nr:hypothetical protein [Planctomycetia bacterium]
MWKSRITLKIAAPMVALSLLLLAVGITAAWHVQQQQFESSELIAREVHGMIAAEEIFTAMREIRRELDLFLRSRERKHLENVDMFLRDSQPLIEAAKDAARTPEESEMVKIVADGYERFKREYALLRDAPANAETERAYAHLVDEVLTNTVLVPARACINYDKQVVDRTTEASRVTAQYVRTGFLLLGITGSIAGLLVGVGLARAVNRSIVQLEVSVRGVAGKLNEVNGAVFISRYSDFAGVETSIRHVEREITQVVERLQQRETELLRSEQLAIVGQLAAGLAHELRNPLMPIKVLVQSALSREGEAPLNRRQLTIINEELIRLEESIQSFLDFARPPELSMRPIDVAEVIYQALDLVYPKAHQHDVELHCVVPSRRVTASGDMAQLKQLLLNLLLNSLDEMPDGGMIQIVLEAPDPAEHPPTSDAMQNLDSEQDALRVAADAPTEELPMFRIRLFDTGAGFPDEMLPRIFEPFVTSKDTGTGLGLTICRQIVAAHGGKISAHNRSPRGAEFVIEMPFLPVSQESPASGAMLVAAN